MDKLLYMYFKQNNFTLCTSSSFVVLWLCRYIFKHESTHLSQIFKWAFVNKFIFCRTVGFIITIPSYIQMQSWLNVLFVLAFSN